MSKLVDTSMYLFELNMDKVNEELQARELARATETILTLGKVAMDFARVERVPRYDTESRESDVEHSFMLQLVAVELAEAHYPGLDSGLVAKFSTVHDLPELLVGDVATFDISEEELRQKAEREATAMEKLADILPPHTYSLLERYEEQTEPEARFVRFIDKLLPLVVDIHGPGLKVMNEDYSVYTLTEYLTADKKQATRYEQFFPEDSFNLLHILRQELSRQFATEFSS